MNKVLLLIAAVLLFIAGERYGANGRSADLNRDGKVDGQDALRIIRKDGP